MAGFFDEVRKVGATAEEIAKRNGVVQPIQPPGDIASYVDNQVQGIYGRTPASLRNSFQAGNQVAPISGYQQPQQSVAAPVNNTAQVVAPVSATSSPATPPISPVRKAAPSPVGKTTQGIMPTLSEVPSIAADSPLNGIQFPANMPTGTGTVPGAPVASIAAPPAGKSPDFISAQGLNGVDGTSVYDPATKKWTPATAQQQAAIDENYKSTAQEGGFIGKYDVLNANNPGVIRVLNAGRETNYETKPGGLVASGSAYKPTGTMFNDMPDGPVKESYQAAEKMFANTLFNSAEHARSVIDARVKADMEQNKTAGEAYHQTQAGGLNKANAEMSIAEIGAGLPKAKVNLLNNQAIHAGAEAGKASAEGKQIREGEGPKGKDSKLLQESQSVYEKAHKSYLELVKDTMDESLTPEKKLANAELYATQEAQKYVQASVAMKKKKDEKNAVK